MNQTWHNSKHSRHSKVGNTYMAQTTPTHASGFHLVTVAMTGHVEDKGSTTVAHSILKRCCLNAITESRGGNMGLYRYDQMGLLAWWSSSRVLPFSWILGNILGGSTYHERHHRTQSSHGNMQQYDACYDMAIWGVLPNAMWNRLVWVHLNQRFKWKLMFLSIISVLACFT